MKRILKAGGILLAVLLVLVIIGHLVLSARNHSDEKEPNPDAPSWLDSSLYPFQHRFAEIDGHRVHYIEEGVGPSTIVFFHGNPTSSFLYRDIVKALRGEHRCIAADYPGFGMSRAKEGYSYLPVEHSTVMEKLLERLEVKDAIFMVQDWGGPIGLGLAGRRPEMTRALAIGNTWAWPVNDDPGVARFSKLMGGPLGSLLIHHYNVFVNVFLPGGVARRQLSEGEMKAYRGPFPTRESRKPVHVFPREILESKGYLAQVEANLTKLADRPVLIIWGTSDRAFKESHRRRFEKLFPRHETRILEGAAHYIQEEAAPEIAKAIDAFAKANPVSSAASP